VCHLFTEYTSEIDLKGLSIENISMRFDLKDGKSIQALKDVTLDIDGGQIITVLGPSGCGKTTLLNIIAGFLAPTEGQVVLNDQIVTGPAAERGMVFQQGALFEWMNVRSNVAFGPRMKGMPKDEQNKKVQHLLEVVGLGDFEDKAVYELSGGMQQRVALARCLANDPDVIAPRPGRILKEYKLPYAEMGSGMDLREVKKSEGYIETRDEILSIIWEMEEEIMGRVENN